MANFLNRILVGIRMLGTVPVLVVHFVQLKRLISAPLVTINVMLFF